jgi:GMP synthase-like glutamine amidotransferase
LLLAHRNTCLPNERIGVAGAASSKSGLSAFRPSRASLTSRRVEITASEKVLQWHSVQVSQPPDHAVVLASSNSCRVQAMHLGRYAWSMQYHVEVEPDTIVNWGAVPAYRQALEATLGPGALDRMKVEAEANMSGFANNAERLYSNFMAAIAETA